MARVLVIEDDASFRGILKEALEQNHYEVITAANGSKPSKASRWTS